MLRLIFYFREIGQEESKKVLYRIKPREVDVITQLLDLEIKGLNQRQKIDQIINKIFDYGIEI